VDAARIGPVVAQHSSDPLPHDDRTTAPCTDDHPPMLRWSWTEAPPDWLHSPALAQRIVESPPRFTIKTVKIKRSPHRSTASPPPGTYKRGPSPLQNSLLQPVSSFLTPSCPASCFSFLRFTPPPPPHHLAVESLVSTLSEDHVNLLFLFIYPRWGLAPHGEFQLPPLSMVHHGA
jgi:hypothetical protein